MISERRERFTYDFTYPSQRMPVLARNVVATSQPLAAQAGLRMLLRGGTATDAAIATAATLTVVEPTSNGIGSDAFALVWDGTGLHGLNASGRSPRALDPTRFGGLDAMPLHGWDPVTVPGAVSAWSALHKRFGRLPFAELFEPAVHYAEAGFAVSPLTARGWARAPMTFAGIEEFGRAFLLDGRAPAAGETFRFPEQAWTLQRIAETGGEAFYRGDVADRIVAHARATGGVLAAEDLAEHVPSWVEPIRQRYGTVELAEIPPNGQGLAALLALGILEQFDLRDLPVDSVEGVHLQIEAMKLAFADAHRYVADPAFMDVDVDALLAPEYLRERAQLIRRDRAQDPGAGKPPDDGTVYLTAADADGSMVSFIQSNYYGFGSGVVVPGTGISLQNRGAGFSLDPGNPNHVAPRKRPFHTIIPGFVTADGAPLMSFGVMGGPMQPQGHVQMVVRLEAYGQNPQTASDAPRWQVLHGRTVAMENGFPSQVLEGLAALGHDLQVRPPEESFAFGGAQLAYRSQDGYVAASDHRKDGQAVGF